MKGWSRFVGALLARGGRFLWSLPRNILISVLMLYRRVVSPLYGQVCRFFPSCSAYALEAITVHGATKGSWLSARRLVRCHPWNHGGVDQVPAGGRQWSDPAKTPRIIVLNHPQIPSDVQRRPAARGA